MKITNKNLIVLKQMLLLETVQTLPIKMRRRKILHLKINILMDHLPEEVVAAVFLAAQLK